VIEERNFLLSQPAEYSGEGHPDDAEIMEAIVQGLGTPKGRPRSEVATLGSETDSEWAVRDIGRDSGRRVNKTNSLCLLKVPTITVHEFHTDSFKCSTDMCEPQRIRSRAHPLSTMHTNQSGLYSLPTSSDSPQQSLPPLLYRHHLPLQIRKYRG